MRIGKYLLAVFFVLCLGTAVYAAPVGLTSADETEGGILADNNMAVTVGVVVDSISERKLNFDSSEFEMDIYLARIGLSLLDRFKVYLDLGSTSGMEYNYVLAGEKYLTKFEDEFMWGVGASAMIYKWDNDLQIGANVSYRTADMVIDETTIDNTNYKRAEMSAITEDEFEEIQGAVELAWKKEVFTPYVGIKFSDVEVGARYTLDAQVRDALSKSADQNIGIFLGLNITPKLEGELLGEKLAINLEARLIDEEAGSIEVSYKF